MYSELKYTTFWLLFSVHVIYHQAVPPTYVSLLKRLISYLESFWRRVREQKTKTAQRIEHAYAETPAELAGWMPTESGTGRLATGGKASASTPGKMRTTTSAPADMYREKENYYPSSMWTNLTDAYNNGFLSNDMKRLLPINSTEPNQTCFSNFPPHKRTFRYDEEDENKFRNGVGDELMLVPNTYDARGAYERAIRNKNKFRNIVSPELPLVPNTCDGSYASKPKSKNKGYFDFLRVQYPTNNVDSKKDERYEDEDLDQFTNFVASYTTNSMLDLRK